MQETQRSQQLAGEYISRSGRRLRRDLVRSLRNTAFLGLGLAAAQYAHVHPDVVNQVPSALDGLTKDAANILYAVTDAGYHVADFAGNLLGHIPFADKLPHLAENQTPAGSYINEHLLTDVEVSGLSGLALRAIKHRKKEAPFKNEASRMGHIPDIGAGIQLGNQEVTRSAWNRLLPLGDPAEVARKVLENPMNKWNKARIVHSIVHTLSETIVADEKVKPRISKKFLLSAGGEVAEQGAKIAFIHAASFLGFLFWAPSHVYTEWKSRKNGTPEAIKVSWELMLPSLLPGFGGIAGALLTIPAEISTAAHEEKVYSYLLAGINKSLQKSGPKTSEERYTEHLVRRTFAKPEIAQAVQTLPQIVQDLNPKNASPELQEYNRKIAREQAERDAELTKLLGLEHRNAIVRALRGRKLRSLEKKVRGLNTKLYNTMQKRFEKFDHDYQLALALDAMRKNLSVNPSRQS